MYLDPEYSEHLKELALYSRVWLALAFLSLGLIALFTLRLSSRLQLSGRKARKPIEILRLLHHSDSAIASLEYLLVLLPFLIIVMTVWQLAFMFNAQLHVGYSAYTAARSAAVLISSVNGNEQEGVLKNNSSKWKSIRRASIPGTLSISPGNEKTAAGVWPATGARLSLMAAHTGGLSANRLRRGAVKSIYADNMTVVFINGVDHRGQDAKGKSKVADAQNLSSANIINVTVKYVFWLQVPYVGRMLELAFGDKPLSKVLANPFPSMVLTETISMKTWPLLRATDPC